jgi:hypothetical protein
MLFRRLKTSTSLGDVSSVTQPLVSPQPPIVLHRVLVVLVL